MAVKGSTYAQELPEGVKRHRVLLKEMQEAARARREKKRRDAEKGKKGDTNDA